MRNLDPALVAKRRRLVGAVHLSAVGSARQRRSCGRSATATHAMLDADARPGGCRSSRTVQRCAGIDEVIAFCRQWADERRELEFDTDGVVVKVDDLALRDTAGDDREVPAVGDGVQVPRAAGAHEAAADRRQRRPDRREHAVRRARAGVRRRLDDLDGDAAQRRGHRAQGPPRRRHGRHREGRRRHPARRRADPQPAPGRIRAVGDADRRAPRAAASSHATKRRSSGAARTRRARRGCAAASSTSPRAAR